MEIIYYENKKGEIPVKNGINELRIKGVDNNLRIFFFI